MSAQAKSIHTTATRFPARPRGGAVDVKAAHARIAKRFPKILAKLAE